MEKESNQVLYGEAMDIYTNSISVVANPTECLVRLCLDTPSDEVEGEVLTERLANVRMSFPLAKALIEILQRTIEEVEKNQQGIIEND